MYNVVPEEVYIPHILLTFLNFQQPRCSGSLWTLTCNRGSHISSIVPYCCYKLIYYSCFCFIARLVLLVQLVPLRSDTINPKLAFTTGHSTWELCRGRQFQYINIHIILFPPFFPLNSESQWFYHNLCKRCTELFHEKSSQYLHSEWVSCSNN